MLVSTNKSVSIKTGDYTIGNSECEKLLDVKIDVNINFNNHICHFCKRASRKISALARVTRFKRLSKRKLLMNVFFTSQFSYCPPIWMRHIRSINRKMIILLERYLRMIYNDKKSFFPALLIKTVLSQFTLDTFEGLQLKCLGSIMDYHYLQ